ncbi:MAG: XkdX family protein [Eubacteriaceae bacterium]|nr:XkdX family protein [Eubacteriaceae bacterium]
MFNILKKMYQNDRITKEKLHWYVDKGVITQAQYDEIITPEAETGTAAQ